MQWQWFISKCTQGCDAVKVHDTVALPPLVAVKFSQQVEAPTLLAEALGQAILDEAAQLEVDLAEPISLIVVLCLAEILATSLNLLKSPDGRC